MAQWYCKLWKQKLPCYREPLKPEHLPAISLYNQEKTLAGSAVSIVLTSIEYQPTTRTEEETTTSVYKAMSFQHMNNKYVIAVPLSFILIQ